MRIRTVFWFVLLLIAPTIWAKGKSSMPDVDTRIIQLEDARSLGDGELEALLQHKLPDVRYRAALAMGRIGDKRGTDALLKALDAATTSRMRIITVFALGEIEDTKAAQALLSVLEKKIEAVEVRARAAEALGKIVSFQLTSPGAGQNAGPANADTLGKELVEKINQALIAQLPAPNTTLTPANKLLASLTITALMRVRLPSSVTPLTKQLESRDADIRAEAGNALMRLRHPINSAVPALLMTLEDRAVNVRANSARAVGLSKDASAFEPLTKLLNDPSDLVQVSAIRGLASLADRRAVAPLLTFGETLLKQYRQAKTNGSARPAQINLLLELATALGTFKDESIVPFLQQLRAATGTGAYTEIESELVKFGDQAFWVGVENNTPRDWRSAATFAQALAELGSERAKATLLTMWEQAEQGKLEARVMPALLRALSRIKYDGLQAAARRQLTHKEISVRAAAANALTELNDENFKALAAALEQAKADVQSDARLALVNAIGKYKTPQAIQLLKAALADTDARVRRATANLLRQAGETVAAETTALPHDEAYYTRVRRLQSKQILVTMHTSKGIIKIQMFANDAPMTVDNFIELAKKKYFDGIVFHRIVPNFVAQGGDPRGDGGGGPGYQIRCEINPRKYERGTMGMALSGKDTGGSQFFFCHTPQPHLDGGYTVFGQVIAGMEAVDKLTRGDMIERVVVSERNHSAAKER
ncbi:MAG: peptidylprolyl isomerase [Blastocatellia bacterium]|nr:peptidylprolyl isomerase [Blastocatellia bacterium]